MEPFDVIRENLPNINEAQAIELYWRLCKKFGWTGTFFTRDDVQSEWASQMELATEELHFDKEMPDDVWSAVTTNYYWTKGMPDRLTEEGWTLLSFAVDEAIEATKENK